MSAGDRRPAAAAPSLERRRGAEPIFTVVDELHTWRPTNAQDELLWQVYREHYRAARWWLTGCVS